MPITCSNNFSICSFSPLIQLPSSSRSWIYLLKEILWASFPNHIWVHKGWHNKSTCRADTNKYKNFCFLLCALIKRKKKIIRSIKGLNSSKRNTADYVLCIMKNSLYSPVQETWIKPIHFGLKDFIHFTLRIYSFSKQPWKFCFWVTYSHL